MGVGHFGVFPLGLGKYERELKDEQRRLGASYFYLHRRDWGNVLLLGFGLERGAICRVSVIV